MGAGAARGDGVIHFCNLSEVGGGGSKIFARCKRLLGVGVVVRES